MRFIRGFLLRTLIIVMASAFAVSSFAADDEASIPKRVVNFEWEESADARGYELEIKKLPLESKKVYTFKTDKAAWDGKLKPGNYLMRVRALDRRKVPGEWGEDSGFQVMLENVVISKPKSNEIIKTKSNESAKMDFQWKPVAGAKKYHLTITTDTQQEVLKTETEESQFSTELPVAKAYEFKVSAENVEGITTEAATVASFTLEGNGIAAPVMAKPESTFIRQMTWEKVPYAETYTYAIQRFDAKSKKWSTQTNGTTDTNELAFDPKWPGSIYRITLQAEAKLRPKSKLSKILFKVYDGDRSPASEFTVTVRQSIDRVTRWYGLISYLFTQVNYYSSSVDTAGFASYETLGGTIRTGVGWEELNRPWGFLGIVDISGFQSEQGGLLSYPSAELSAVYKTRLRSRDELRTHMGLFYRELPATITNGLTQSYENTSIVTVGPHIGVEYWYALTPKWGIQGNLHLYMNSTQMKTPNGQKIIPSMSNQLGIMASYRSSDRLSYLAGITRREDKIKYQKISNPLCSAQFCSGDNEVQVEGTFLNFYAEYDF